MEKVVVPLWTVHSSERSERVVKIMAFYFTDLELTESRKSDCGLLK
jgi:hypothetical protein